MNVILTPLESDPNFYAETLMKMISPKDARWGYNTRDFAKGLEVIEQDIDESDEDVVYEYFTPLEDEEFSPETIYKAFIPSLELTIFLSWWNGDGTLVFHSREGNWALYTYDCKKDYEWDWLKDIS